VSTSRTLRIGTRGSQLALWQANAVGALLKHCGHDVEIAIIRTTGDRLQEAPLSETGGKRLFVKEIEDALGGDEVDLAVHSAKDMPARLPDGLEIAAVLAREDPRDAMVLPGGTAADGVADIRRTLGASPTIGTGSVRRTAQLTAVFPRASFAAIRGNVDTRLRKLDEGGYHALVLAAAGLRRLGLGARISTALPIETCIPAPGQGIVAIEIRANDPRAKRALAEIDDWSARTSLDAERALVNALGGGCQLPLGGIALHVGGELEMHAVVASPDGRRAIKRRGRGSVADPGGLGRRLADELARDGATEILDSVRRAPGPVTDSH
jgi:hydroxymethylbilane synthase